MTLREQICDEARSWIGTRFHHHAAVKGCGVDCAHLVRAVYMACGVSIDPIYYYPRDWHLHRSDELFMDFVMRYADRIEERELLPGDVILWKFGLCFSHGGIYVGDDRVVHAVIQARRVIVSRLSEAEWSSREHRFFRMRANVNA